MNAILKRILRTLGCLGLILSLVVLPACGEQSGGVLNLYGSDPLTLDPAVAGEATSSAYIMEIFSGLVYLDEGMNIAPDIAESWEVSSNGLTYTFYLRKDALFHNGRQVTAEDFKYSWERALKPETGSQTAEVYLGDIKGAAEVLSGEAEGLSGVQVLNAHTLEVTLSDPVSYFLYKLTYPVSFVVDRENVSSINWWLKPNGTGPFKLKSWQKGESLVLEKNELFYREAAHLDEVDFHILAGVPMDLYESGIIDIAPVGASDIYKAADPSGPFYEDLRISPELSFYYIGFNTTKPPFDDPLVRKAFALAIDKEELTTLVFNQMLSAARGILPPGMPGFDENLEGLAFDPDEAREALSLSSYGSAQNLPPVTITTSGWGGFVSQDLEAIINEWRVNLGVEVKVRQLEPELFLYNLKEEKDEMFYTGWIADYPHPQDFLEVLFASYSPSNSGGYTNLEVDRLLKEASQTDNFDLYQNVERLILEDAACVPLWWGQNFMLVKPYVKDYNLTAMGYARLENVHLEAEGVGFEPTVPEGTAVFKTVSIDHSDTPPLVKYSKN